MVVVPVALVALVAKVEVATVVAVGDDRIRQNTVADIDPFPLYRST